MVAPQQTSQDLKKQIAALKWQKNMRQAMNKKLNNPNILRRVKSKRTRKVEEIEREHQTHRQMALQNIKQQHATRRSSIQLRLELRKKAKCSNGLPAVNR